MRENMAQKPIEPKPVQAKDKKGTTTNGNSKRGRKPAVAMSLISTHKDALALPLGSLTESTAKIDLLNKAFIYDVNPHVPTKGKHKGEKQMQFSFETPDGVRHTIYQDLAVALGWAIRTRPIIVVELIAAEQEICPQAS